MPDLNKVLLMGRLTRDPQSRTTPSGQSVCELSVRPAAIPPQSTAARRLRGSSLVAIVTIRLHILRTQPRQPANVDCRGRLYVA